uniref:Trace amine-associated receptor 3721.TAAR351B n=1 Tax=Petromyzon marinus TaxID=7757 RepID=A0A678XEM8_PETMA|nr:trace amine-associated receptor 3721.TAAR351B [Petromyzon marinus]
MNESGSIDSSRRCVWTFHQVSCTSSDLSAAERATLLAILLSISAITIAGNILTIASILYFRQLQTRPNVLTLSLAVADLLVGLLIMPFNAMSSMHNCLFYGRVSCRVHTWLDYIFCTSSIVHLSCISFDRYVAISDPLRYSDSVTHAALAAMLALSWFSFPIDGLVFMMQWNLVGLEEETRRSCPDDCEVILNLPYAVAITTCAFVLTMLLMALAYDRIYRLARVQSREINSLGAQVQKASSDGECLSKWNAMKRDHNATITLGIIIGIFIVIWMPYFVVSATEPMVGYQAGPVAWEVINWFTYLNSMANPILFAAFNMSYRWAFRLLVMCSAFRPGIRGVDLFNFMERPA